MEKHPALIAFVPQKDHYLQWFSMTPAFLKKQLPHEFLPGYKQH